MSILVTGGAGYIGSHAILELLDQGCKPIVLDNLSTGFARLVPEGVPLVVGDIGDRELVTDVIKTHEIDTILHFAGKVVVADSIVNPLDYYLSNTVKAHSLITVAVKCDIRNFIFSSTAAVYGQSDRLCVDEAAPLAPISPYGASKMMTENILRDAGAAHGLNYAILRYFNVAGADPLMRCGQATRNASHLIKLALAVAAGERELMEIYGDDYHTTDGTCVRDFIHVADLARAHLVALRALASKNGSLTLNCGYGRGYSVKEVLKAVEDVTGKVIAKRVVGRRSGDPVSLIADSARLRSLGWVPQFDDLHTIVDHAHKWEAILKQLD